MKRFLPLVALITALSLVAMPLALAATASAAPAKSDKSPAAPIAGALSTVTGIAISPLLGTGAYGAYKWVSAKDAAARSALPWYAQVTFWLPALLIVGVCAAKDAFGAVIPPGWKKPLDVLETIENKATGLVAAGAVVPFTMMALSDMLTNSPAVADAHMVPTGLAMLPLGTIDLSWLLNLLTVPFGIAVFAIVWLASHAINVLILLSPWGAIDAALKTGRTALLGLLTVSATLNPWVGAGLSLVVILIAYLVAGWSFRLTVFGTVFCWDFLTLRRLRFAPAQNSNLMFAGGNLPEVPVRTYGRLVKQDDGGCEFVYRPWLWLPQRTAVLKMTATEFAVGRGLFFSTITRGEYETLFLLPPRYRGHEETVASAYGWSGGVRPVGLRKAWSVLRDLFGGAAARTQVV
ncbi:hypothetical protein [Opitutus terrae]|uniref:Uncharacterized protein n=1 Tax=Opitutus terrae (strain DSM 11246 / JCM 15787 / PB90-1) TaxID=452637 RepID=B1ZSV8_OPITP|nr:hypothetical protein [Opitutus terrae]ACB74802.1 conserved hypothetical protein [Opitutus terrae PB90-1]